MAETLENYITEAYPRWTSYAAYQIHAAGLQLEPAEAVNDALCTLLEQSPEKLQSMAATRSERGCELDFFLKHILKMSIRSPRSPLRYQRGQHCTGRLQGEALLVPDSGAEAAEWRQNVVQTLDELGIGEPAREIFLWKFIDGRPLAQWPGEESYKVVYGHYNRTLRRMIAALKKKYGAR